ncbi:MAG: PEP-CTERM sorting domain-containing protein [Planctomycetota bacterium]|nr:MAG: PEP-CTERM sorting domain-containing protein [Planctomycetota bacterium]
MVHDLVDEGLVTNPDYVGIGIETNLAPSNYWYGAQITALAQNGAEIVYAWDFNDPLPVVTDPASVTTDQEISFLSTPWPQLASECFDANGAIGVVGGFHDDTPGLPDFTPLVLDASYYDPPPLDYFGEGFIARLVFDISATGITNPSIVVNPPTPPANPIATVEFRSLGATLGSGITTIVFIPEPATLMLLTPGLALVLCRRRTA